MTEYVFSKGKVTVRHDVTLKIDRHRPHAYHPAFLVLAELTSAESGDSQDDKQKEGKNDTKHDKS